MINFLALNPAHREAIVTDPSTIPNAVEEMLRWMPIVAPARTVVKPVQLAGQKLLPGDRVLMPVVSALRDESTVPDAGEVKFDRDRPRNLAFGYGTHTCLGMHLARRELTVALTEWHARIPDYKVIGGGIEYVALLNLVAVHRLTLELGGSRR
jgi:cytochrome P450